MSDFVDGMTPANGTTPVNGTMPANGTLPANGTTPANGTMPGRRLVAVIGSLGVFPMVRISLPGRRLLVYLAVSDGRAARGAASGALWPDTGEEAGRANLRRALWHVPRGWVRSEAENLVLEADQDLAAAHRAAATALTGGPLTLSEITMLSRDILPSWHDEWIIPAQDAFHLLRVQALEAACRTMVSGGAHALATQAGAAALAAEPLRESAAAALIEAHLAQCNRHEAAQCFRAFAKRLRIELGIRPDPVLSERIAHLAIAPDRR